MAHRIQQSRLLPRFSCLGAECPDTCCHGWEMPADAAQLARYERDAPELLAAVDTAQGSMCRSASTGYCNQLQDGMCGIHTRYGEQMLGDACHFYPRMFHRFGDAYMMTAALSCPQVARLMLSEPDPYGLQEPTQEVIRLPQQRCDLLPVGIDAAEVMAVMQRCAALAADPALSAEAAIARLVHAAFTSSAEVAIPPVQAQSSDPVMLYYALSLLLAFGETIARPNLDRTLSRMEARLGCRFDSVTREIRTDPDSAARIRQLRAMWQADAATALAPTLKRWLAAQLAMTAFPYGGFTGIDLMQKAAVLVQRFATVKLALMCHIGDNGTPPDEDEVVRILYSLSRFMDHIADAELTLMIHRDAGWTSEERLLGLLS